MILTLLFFPYPRSNISKKFLCLLCVFSYFITIRLEKKYSRLSLAQSVNLTTITTVHGTNNNDHNRGTTRGDGTAGQMSNIEEEQSVAGKMNKSSSLITQESGLINYNNRSPRQGGGVVGAGRPCTKDVQSSSSITESGITSSPARQLNREKKEMEEREKNEKKSSENSSSV